MYFQEIALLNRTERTNRTEEDLIAMFVASKSGWRKKPTTALRQEKQLRKLFAQVSETMSASEILRTKLDDIEHILINQVTDHSASVKSQVIALLEFQRYASVRDPELNVEWDAVRRRLETWKRDACAADLQREATLQDKMGEDGYLPSAEELSMFRQRVLEELPTLSDRDSSDIRRSHAVRMRRLLTSALLLQNFQRAGTIKNAKMAEFRQIHGSVLRVRDHKSSSSYGSANLVVKDLEDPLQSFVNKFRHLLVKNEDDSLFPLAEPALDIGVVCESYGIRKLSPTELRKVASTAAFDKLDDEERRKLATHMTHRSDTQFKAYSAKNRRSEATKTVERMGQILYGAAEASSTVPSSAGALRRETFNSQELSLIEAEARRLFRCGQSVTHNRAMMLMSKHVPIFDKHSPRSVETKMRSALSQMRVSVTRSGGRRRH